MTHPEGVRVAASNVIGTKLGEMPDLNKCFEQAVKKIEKAANGEEYQMWNGLIVSMFDESRAEHDWQAKIYWTLKSEPTPEIYKYVPFKITYQCSLK